MPCLKPAKEGANAKRHAMDMLAASKQKKVYNESCGQQGRTARASDAIIYAKFTTSKEDETGLPITVTR